MVGSLLLRGMLVGLLAGVLSFAFLKLVGEPQVDRAIAFEARMDEAKARVTVEEARARGLPAPPVEADEEIVSRPTQAGIGLFTGVGVYGVAFGGLFALAYALAYGRMAALGPRPTAAVLALLGLVAVYLVPNLKYPANPPSVGAPDTIGMRTSLYFAMVSFSLVAMVGAGMLRHRLLARYGGWNAGLLAAAAYLIGVLAAGALMPGVNEVPDGFPATVLWEFRVASLGAQTIIWTTLGVLFGALTERAAARDGLWAEPIRAPS